MDRDTRIEVIATGVSGSISDWAKVERIQPLFADRGWAAVNLSKVERHAEARTRATELVHDGARLIISAGGSGTFNAVMTGCIDAGVPLDEIRLGFLRKGSADLIGKVLGMPDEIETAIDVFSEAIEQDRTAPCDLLRVDAPHVPPRYFVGYGGAELFGRIPHFTENRFMKWYKGVLSQMFGDLGPFTTGMTLALIERVFTAPFTRAREWILHADGVQALEGRFQALIIVNGYLGKDLAFSDDALGSGRFHCFALRDHGILRLLAQAKAARSGIIADDPEYWGMEHVICTESLELNCGRDFALNVDGSTLKASGITSIRRVGVLQLLCATDDG
jgi:diacylglycerol kinase family enzyme